MGVISIHYPSKTDSEAPEAVIDEWYRIIGHLDYDEAIARLDAWMENPDNKKAPRAVDLKLHSGGSAARRYESAEGSIGPYMIDADGNLTNERGMVYAFPQWPDAKFRYDQQGNICYASTGAVAIPWMEVRMRREAAENLSRTNEKRRIK